MPTVRASSEENILPQRFESVERVFITRLEVNVMPIFFYCDCLKRRGEKKRIHVKQKLAMRFSNRIEKIELTCGIAEHTLHWNKFHQYATHIHFHFKCARRLIICTFAGNVKDISEMWHSACHTLWKKTRRNSAKNVWKFVNRGS